MQALRPVLVIALCASLCAPSSFAGFSIARTRVSVGNGLDRYDIVAVNDGVATDTLIKSLDFLYYSYFAAPAAFEVWDITDPGGGDPDGIPDTVNLLSSSRTRIRVSTTVQNNVFAGVSPTNGYAQPNPYLAGAARFSGSIANTGVTHATGAGFQIARIFIPSDGIGVFRGRLGGDDGATVPFSIVLSNYADLFLPPDIVNNNATTDAVIGSDVSEGAPFSIQIHATDPDTSFIAFRLGVLPVGLSNVNVKVQAEPYQATFTVTGVADSGLIGSTVPVAFTIESSDPFNVAQTPGTFFVRVTPEPRFALAFIGFGRRRCRDVAGISG